MKDTKALLAIPAVLLLAACSSSPYRANWTHPSLAPAAQEREVAQCRELALQAQDNYLTANSRNTLNSAGWVNLNSKARTESNMERDKVYAECMREAGFTME